MNTGELNCPDDENAEIPKYNPIPLNSVGTVYDVALDIRFALPRMYPLPSSQTTTYPAGDGVGGVHEITPPADVTLVTGLIPDVLFGK